jgi:hypothetical protein
VVQNALGTRTTDLAVRLLFAARSRLHDPHGIVLFTDGWLPYESLFPAVFERPFQPQRRGKRGRFPRLQYHISRTSGHVRIIKTYQGKRVTNIRIERAAGSQRRIDQEHYLDVRPAHIVAARLGLKSSEMASVLVGHRPAGPEQVVPRLSDLALLLGGLIGGLLRRPWPFARRCAPQNPLLDTALGSLCAGRSDLVEAPLVQLLLPSSSPVALA